MFEPEKKKFSSPIVLVMLGGLFIAGLLGVGLWYYIGLQDQKVAKKRANNDLRDSIVMLLAQPRFSGEKFREQMLGKARLMRFIIQQKDLYISYPEATEEEFEKGISSFLLDTKKIERLKATDGKYSFGEYRLRKGPETAYFFKTSLSNMTFDVDRKLDFAFESGTYTISVPELIALASNEKIYGGKLYAANSNKVNQIKFAFANHGMMVAKPDEPTLKRFVDILLKEIPKNDRELKIQRLLDFVSNEIEYDYAEALSTRETLKRPNETLMSRRSDCSNKTILMASFLEQIGEEYLMLYMPGHITIAVPQGKFADDNNMTFTWDEKKWVIAETTAPFFEIGKSKLENAEIFKQVQYVQKPNLTNVIFDAQTFKTLDFF
ncbi:MAG: hypothetical protein KDB79_14660 [Acidobacteria bacterium]|nr:hypothetical protein [Acidobacteriota bacterium]